MTDTKAVSVLTADIKAAPDDDGTYDITLSVPTLDRDGEIVDAKAFEPLPEWLNIDVDHGMSVLTTVGSGRPEYDGDRLMLRGFSFASTSLGQDVKTLVDEGHIRKMSVAFMAATREVDEKDGKPHIRRAELLNAAVVAIPSNREADIIVAGKSVAAELADREAKMARLGDALEAVRAAQEELAEALADARTGKTATIEIAGDPAGSDDTSPEKAAAPAAASPATGAVAKARAFGLQANQTLADLSA